MKIYTVTFCAMDQEVDANIFWHTFLLLSHYDATTKKLEVLENWGFGGVPATSPYPLLRELKRKLSLDTDFYGNHGMFYHEEMRYLERGYGLHGVTFELTEQKFKLLQERCAKMFKDQEEAIREAVQALGLKPKEIGKVRNYAFEHKSDQIYRYELMRAETENRPPRLHEFSLSPSFTARTCKTHILNLLDGIITQQQLERITGCHPAITRFSGKLETIHLHSKGPLLEHTKRSGEKVHYREGKSSKLYWTVLPQEVDTISERTSHLFKIHEDQCDNVKSIVRKLQSLEWFFRDLNLQGEQTKQCDELVDYIIKLYESFSFIDSKKPPFAQNGWCSFWKWLASQPRDNAEKLLLDKMAKAKHFMNSLYMMIVDGWCLGVANEASQHQTNHPNEANDLESLVYYLSKEQQEALCQIIGRKYIAMIEEEHRSPNDFLEDNIASLTENSNESYPQLPRLH